MTGNQVKLAVKQLLEDTDIQAQVQHFKHLLTKIDAPKSAANEISSLFFGVEKMIATNEHSCFNEELGLRDHSLEEKTKAFEELTDTGLNATEEGISESLEEVTNAFALLTDAANEALVQDTISNQEIFEEIVNFFTKDDWSYTKMKGEQVLRLAFQGKNGKYACYAKARVQQQQMVFYSVCPTLAPESQRLAVAEFIARANYGMIIGNFELDFSSGEIRYKTSIDVSGSNLSFPLIKQLVYANVTMIDEYLPGIMFVIDGGVEPKEAIAQIEGK